MAPESLLAIRERRDQVIAQLSDAFAHDAFDVDELERRLDLAHRAVGLASLEELVADLGPAPTALATTAAAAALQVARGVDDPTRAADKTLRVLFGSVERQGRWVVPETTHLRVWFGSAELDFREASLRPGITTLEVSVTMGSLEVLVPPALEVEIDVQATLGSVEDRQRTSPDPDPARPRLRIVGAVRFGSVEISTALPGESQFETWKRRRRERKALRAPERRALPPGQPPKSP